MRRFAIRPAPSPADAPGVIETRLENGTPVCLRRVDRGDEQRIREGIARMSPHSRYMRFFSGATTPPDWVIDRLLDADGDKHLAWGAIDMSRNEHPAIGAVHAFREEEDRELAEFSVAILDDWHGLGLGKILTATLLLEAQSEGIARFAMNTLAENRSAIAFARLLGGQRTGSDGTVVTYELTVDEALERLREADDPPGIAHVFEAFGAV
ncbi:GNAT family N-acetyltransferase [Erythrobacter sp. SD-21]|uniref:GNAT family N-acetyltransferase n=1 Tax=Erythrobacter sp. SD-21 TaxID=161528 RepID=UPI001F2AB124|nr:GNAT family N-acetyltransferase [Erythrobacter sp. SD-21]